jgi:hypothetical protein
VVDWLRRPKPTARTVRIHLPKSASTAYIASVVNNRKEVIQCLIVNRRGRRHP